MSTLTSLIASLTGIEQSVQLYETAEDRADASCKKILAECCEVFTDNQNRELARSYLVSRGIDMVLRGYKENKDSLKATTNAILMLETCSSLNEGMGTATDFMKGMDAIRGCERTTVKFYHERSQCSCLTSTVVWQPRLKRRWVNVTIADKRRKGHH